MNAEMYQRDDKVRIISGPFASFSGQVQEVDAVDQRLKIKIEIFGRKTIVYLTFSEVVADQQGKKPPLTSLN